MRLDCVSLLVRYGPRCDLRAESVAVSAVLAVVSAQLLRALCCPQALCDLTACRQSHVHFIMLGVLPLLMAQSRMPDLALRRRCAQALYNLSCVPGLEVGA